MISIGDRSAKSGCCGAQFCSHGQVVPPPLATTHTVTYTMFCSINSTKILFTHGETQKVVENNLPIMSTYKFITLLQGQPIIGNYSNLAFSLFNKALQVTQEPIFIAIFTIH